MANTTRRSHTGEALTYAAVGSSQASDVLLYPPKGFRSSEESLRLGSGQERFDAAVAALLTWGVQRGAGMSVENVELPPVSENEYHGLVYDPAGNPVGPREAEPAQVYTDDGTPGIAPGVSADLRTRVAGVTVTAPVRVICVIDEPNRAGFVYGTLPGHPLSGEESFVVDLDPDGGVWFTITRVSRPNSWLLRLASPFVSSQQKRATRRYLKALLPGRA